MSVAAHPPQALWQASILVPKPKFTLFESCFEDALSISSQPEGEDRIRINAVYPAEPNAASIETALSIAAAAAATQVPALSIARLEDRDWVAEGLKHLDAVTVGRVTVRGAHLPPSPRAGMIDLEVEAATAFGTGHHATTAGCLAAIQKVLRQRRCERILDMGCGTGVLALALARLGPAPVLAADIDPIAVAVAKANARTNRLGHRVRAVVAGAYDAPVLRAAAPFDLVVANILAQPLIDLAPALSGALRPGGFAILSGLLVSQQNRVLAAHRCCGLKLWARNRRDEWVTLVLEKPRGS